MANLLYENFVVAEKQGVYTQYSICRPNLQAFSSLCKTPCCNRAPQTAMARIDRSICIDPRRFAYNI